MVVFFAPQVRDAATGQVLPELVGQQVVLQYPGTTDPVPVTEYPTGVPLPGSVLTVSPLYTLPSFNTPAGVYAVEVVAGDFRTYLESGEGARIAAEAASGSAATSASAAASSAAAAQQAAAGTSPLPPGGTTGQALVKASNEDRDATWATVAPGGGGGGVTSHGALSGLGGDDHQQYHNDARGDARYYTKSEVDQRTASAAGANSAADRQRSNHTGTQAISTIVNLEQRLQEAAASGGGGEGTVTSVAGQVPDGNGAVALALADLDGVGALTNGSLLGVENGQVVSITPEDVTAADVEYQTGQTVAQAIASLLTRIAALENSQPALVNATAPTITGSTVVGSVVTATNGTWTVGGSASTPDSFTYQWLRNGSPISGATSSTYTLVSADLGNGTVSVRVTAVKSGHTSGTATSNPVTVSAGIVPLQIVGTPTTAANSDTSITINRVTAAAAGDLLIAGLRSQAQAGTSDFSPETGSGSWARLGPAWPGSAADNRVQGLYAHRISDIGTEPTSYTFNRAAAATRNAGVLFALRGVPNDAYVDVASPSTLAGYLGTAITGGRRVEALTVTQDDCLQFIIVGGEFTAGNNHVPTTTPTGFTLVAAAVTAGEVAGSSRTYVAVYQRSVDTGSTGTRDVAWGAVTAPVAHSVVIEPQS